jgi:ElaB/YqjD/DUF883 family membrane-anchored ribosome-binding protein
MFHQRASAFGPSVTAIQKHLGAVEKELEKIGRTGGQRASVAVSEASEQIGDAITSIVSDMVDRFRESGRAAGDGAARFGSQAIKLGAGYGNNALQRVSAETEDRPLIMLGVALGVGMLIGAAILSNVSRQSR